MNSNFRTRVSCEYCSNSNIINSIAGAEVGGGGLLVKLGTNDVVQEAIYGTYRSNLPFSFITCIKFNTRRYLSAHSRPKAFILILALLTCRC